MAPIKVDDTNFDTDNRPESSREPSDAEELLARKIAETKDIAEFLSRKMAETKSFAEFLDARQDEINKRREALDEREKFLRRREQELETAALQRQTEQTAELCRELSELRARELKKLSDELETMCRTRTDELNRQLAALEDELSSRREEIFVAEKNLSAAKAELERDQKNVMFDRLRLKKLEETLQNRQSTLDDEIQAGLDERHKILQARLEAAKSQEKNLLDTLREREEELSAYRNFREVYGDTPEILRQKMDDLRERNSALIDELGRRPGEELQADYTRLESECTRLRQERVDINRQLNFMQEQVSELQSLRNRNTILNAAYDELQGRWNDAQEIIDGLQTRIKRLTAADMTPADWDKRAASLREPYLEKPFNAPKLEPNEVAAEDELNWLNRMENLFNDYGITFPRRILYAFHTSFKIANWSPLTVLAGVSGTGKSELPRLYSAFGGLNFITVPVQPNWDSQESMLGFFNSIDNKFDAQPVLRFLVECTEKYDNNMAIVLLDEMNLAHVEHYFADFLSKLETRRSSPEDSVPEIFVNLGAGVKPYGLPLRRNILWCGTMNQDETTKSLSDKVLDRGIVINFPRPRKLKSRTGAKSLEKFCDKQGIAPMSVQLWNSWRERSIKFQGDQLHRLENYRQLLETMNEHLSHAGRAIGHRVWQSIEHYVINYPTVRAAMKEAGSDLTGELSAAIRTAVEDQIVQKVMPKLRGIETRGKSYENCLVPIKGLLNDNGFNLNDDFDRACEMGYGQFMWNSAEYIGNETERENG